MAKKQDEAAVMDEQSMAASLNGQEAQVPDGRVLKTHPSNLVSFTLPDKMTVREQIAFRARINNHMRGLGSEIDDEGNPIEAPETGHLAYWDAGKHILQDWQSEVVADPLKLDIDEETDRRAALIVMWTANIVATHIEVIGGDIVPKG